MSKSMWNIPNRTIGVYKVTNKITNECYIGASKDVRRRWREHFNHYKNPKCKDYNSILYMNIRKYKIENFIFELVEQCENLELSNKERYYVKLYNPEYNRTPGGKGGNVNKPEKLEEIIYDLKYTNMSIKELAQKYNYCEKTIENINYGISWNDEKNQYPIRNYNKIEACTIIFGIQVLQFDKNGNFIKEWRSMSEFCRFYDLPFNSAAHIVHVCKGERKTAYGYIWKYKKDCPEFNN